MLKIAISGSGQDLRSFKDEVDRLIKSVANDTLLESRKNTPIKSGNARKNWVKNQSADTFTVENRVPYIERLEAGASRQAPRGIIGPTLTAIKGKYK